MVAGIIWGIRELVWLGFSGEVMAGKIGVGASGEDIEPNRTPAHEGHGARVRLAAA